MNSEMDKLKSQVARNVTGFRAFRRWTQAELAKRSGLSRSNITYVESGLGNPSLEVLFQIAQAFQISIDELIRACTREFRVYKAEELSRQKRNNGFITKLVPDEIKGFDVDSIELEVHGSLSGAPHMKGTREYFYCTHGKISVFVDGDGSILEAGDLLIFSGDQKHVYTNHDKKISKGVSFLVLPSVVYLDSASA